LEVLTSTNLEALIATEEINLLLTNVVVAGMLPVFFPQCMLGSTVIHR